MGSPLLKSPELTTGMRLDLDEFLARWESLPGLKRAELIEGVVYLPSPVSSEHCRYEHFLSGWLWLYAEATHGCDAGHNGTWTMLGQSPQPDIFLRITEEFGGQSIDTGNLLAGAPELVAEICVTSAEIDFGPKLALYRRALVREYITIQPLMPRIVWWDLVAGSYQEIKPDSKGVLRSECFPGLWLDSVALWANDRRRMHKTLNAGLKSAAHREFVERLTERRKGA